LHHIDIGIIWFDSNKAPLSETVVLTRDEVDEGTVGLRGGWKSANFTVGTTGSPAEHNAPGGAVYFSPFIRWVQGAPRALVLMELTVTQAAGSAPSPQVTLPPLLEDSLAKKAVIFDAVLAKPVRLTEAEAASLSPYQRFMNEWYVVDGDLVH